MTLQECYAALEGDYAGVTSRLPTERMVQKFVLKFLNDGSYDLLLRSMETEDYAEAFRAAHTIKGVCQNLDFTKLYQSRIWDLPRCWTPAASSAKRCGTALPQRPPLWWNR